MNLDNKYDKLRALEILWHLAKSSSFPIRIKLLDFLLKQNGTLTTSKIAENLKIGKSTAQRGLQVFWNLGIVNCDKVETNYPDKFIDYWELNKKNSFVKTHLTARPSL